MLTSPPEPPADGGSAPVDAPSGTRLDGAGVAFWYQATHVARATASCRYRVGNHVEQMSGSIALIRPDLPRRLVAHLDTLVVVRPCLDDECRAMLDHARQAGVRLIADYDDLLFDDAGVDESDAGESLPVGARRNERDTEAYRASLDAFDAYSVSTSALAQHLRRLRPEAEIHTVPNGLSRRWLEQGTALYPAWKPGDRRVIRYFPGSPTHDADFHRVRRPLIEFLSAHPEVSIEVVGHLRFDTSGFPAGRIAQVGYVPYAELPSLLAASWVNLAPLVASDFTACKSAIKFLEAGAFHCPTIATPIGDMTRHANDGLTQAQGAGDWLEALERLTDDEERVRQGRAAAHQVRRYGMASHTTASLLRSIGGATADG